MSSTTTLPPSLDWGLFTVFRFVAPFLLFLAGCQAGGPSNLPTHRDLGGGPTALVEMQLVEDGGCIFGQSDDPAGRWLIVWPSGFRREGQQIVGSNGAVAILGEKASLTGGEYHANQLGFVESLLDTGSSIQCKSDEYFLATAVGP